MNLIFLGSNKTDDHVKRCVKKKGRVKGKPRPLLHGTKGNLLTEMESVEVHLEAAHNPSFGIILLVVQFVMRCL